MTEVRWNQFISLICLVIALFLMTIKSQWYYLFLVLIGICNIIGVLENEQ